MHDIKESPIEMTIGRQVERYVFRVEASLLAKPTHCRVCGHPGCLRWHGRYMRELVTLIRTFTLPVRRLFCSSCGHTFALLPIFVVKFCRYARPVIRHALTMLTGRTYEAVAGLFTARVDPGLAIQTLYSWRRRFGVVMR